MHRSPSPLVALCACVPEKSNSHACPITTGPEPINITDLRSLLSGTSDVPTRVQSTHDIIALLRHDSIERVRAITWERIDETAKSLEEVARIVWSRRRLRMILHREKRHADAA